MVDDDVDMMASNDDGIPTDRVGVLRYVQEGGDLASLDAKWKADRDVVRAAVSKNGNDLGVAAEGLRSDVDIVLVAVRNKPQALRFARFLGNTANEDRVVRSMIEDGKARVAIANASMRVKADEELVRLAVAVEGRALASADSHLQNNIDIVRIAINSDGFAYFSASAELQERPEVVKAAIRRDPRVQSLVKMSNLDSRLRRLSMASPIPSADEAEASRNRSRLREVEEEASPRRREEEALSTQRLEPERMEQDNLHMMVGTEEQGVADDTNSTCAPTSQALENLT
jgi:hypothetical protein